MNNDTSPEFHLITKREMCRRFGYSVNTIREWDRQGMIPGAISLNGKRAYRRDVVEAWFCKAARAEEPAASIIEQFESYWVNKATRDRQNASDGQKAQKIAQSRADFAGYNEYEMIDK